MPFNQFAVLDINGMSKHKLIRRAYNNRLIYFYLAVFSIYLFVLCLFVFLIFSMNSQYEVYEKDKIATIKQQVTQILNHNFSTEELTKEVTTFINEYPIELEISTENAVIYTTFPNISFAEIDQRSKSSAILAKYHEFIPTEHQTYRVYFIIYYDSYKAFFPQQIMLLTLCIFILLVFVSICSFLIYHTLFKPLNLLRHSINYVRRINMKSKSLIEPDSTDSPPIKEFTSLVKKINVILKSASKQYTDLELLLMYEHEQLAFLINIAKGSLHDLKTPLYQTLLENQMILKEAKQSDKTSIQSIGEFNIQQIEHLLRRINFLTKNISDSLATVKNDQIRFNLLHLFEEVSEDFNFLLKRKQMNIYLIAPEKVLVRTNRVAILLILHNLLSNAIKYAILDSEITLTFNQTADTMIDIICSNITTLQHIKRIQNPIVTSLTPSEDEFLAYSSGNGIPLIQSLVTSLNGTLRIITKDNQISIYIRLPIADLS